MADDTQTPDPSWFPLPKNFGESRPSSLPYLWYGGCWFQPYSLMEAMQQLQGAILIYRASSGNQSLPELSPAKTLSERYATPSSLAAGIPDRNLPAYKWVLVGAHSGSLLLQAYGHSVLRPVELRELFLHYAREDGHRPCGMPVRAEDLAQQQK